MKATALHDTPAVTEPRFELSGPIASILAFSRFEVISMKATALHDTPAVMEPHFELGGLNAIILAFSRLELISMLVTARHDTRAVSNPRFGLRGLNAIILTFSRLELISDKTTARKTRGQSQNAVLNFIDRLPSFLPSVELSGFQGKGLPRNAGTYHSARQPLNPQAGIKE